MDLQRALRHREPASSTAAVAAITAPYHRRMDLGAWIEAYREAQATGDEDLMVSLFTEDATYRSSPFREPFRGRDEGDPVTLPGCLLLRFEANDRCSDLREYWHVEPGTHEPLTGWGS